MDKPIALLLLVHLCLLGTGCDGNRSSENPQNEVDSTLPFDSFVLDAVVMDQGTAMDAAFPDMQPDRQDSDTEDFDVVDGGEEDASVDSMIDAQLVDADLSPIPGCEGIEVPPPGVPSDGGVEICNYYDDDGDGLVDEGLQYEILSRPFNFFQFAAVLNPNVINGFLRSYESKFAEGVGEFAIIWMQKDSYEDNLVNPYLVTINENGCPKHRGVKLFSDGLFIHDPLSIKFLNGAYYTTFIPEYTYSAYVSYYKSGARGTVSRYEVTPGTTERGGLLVSSGDKIGAFFATFGEGAGVISTSAFMEIDTREEFPTFSTSPIETYSIYDSGVYFDPDVIDFVKDGDEYVLFFNGDGPTVGAYILKWDEDGEITLPVTRIGPAGFPVVVPLGEGRYMYQMKRLPHAPPQFRHYSPVDEGYTITNEGLIPGLIKNREYYVFFEESEEGYVNGIVPIASNGFQYRPAVRINNLSVRDIISRDGQSAVLLLTEHAYDSPLKFVYLGCPQ